ncbi:hypothetical protein [Christensenella tenuis]|uniref:Uncharacterized protein n=1 Tax=Christensenella tenuis TaxID=2763033 RepID=A0ABR7EF14_9FIRM|nr:hypothetical protein [Christensenella tenuis]MBC5648352.1 hypothetical protein [Christensenella tenuis]
MMSGLAKGLLTGFGISAVGFYFYKKKRTESRFILARAWVPGAGLRETEPFGPVA